MSIFFYFLTAEQTSPKQEEKSTSSTASEQTKESEASNTSGIKLSAGKRAISIAVNELQSVSGFVKPGSYVDVIFISPVPAGENTTAQILLSNVKVLATGKQVKNNANENQDPYEMVTLEVSPNEGAALAFAKEAGTVSLMLRGGNDDKTEPAVHYSYQELREGTMTK